MTTLVAVGAQWGDEGKGKIVDWIAPGADFVVRTRWSIVGTVGHWGHVHQRRNRYEADLTLSPAGGAWKIKGFEVLEKRIKVEGEELREYRVRLRLRFDMAPESKLHW